MPLGPFIVRHANPGWQPQYLKYPYYPHERVMTLATKDQTDKAITAVKNGVASKDQEEIASRAAKQSGSTGIAARDAFRK